MAQVIYSRRALDDFERLADFLREIAPHAALEAVDLIRDGIEIFARHPLIGRACEHDLRELIISYGKSGYIALYSYEPLEDAALILVIRHQREAGYADFT